MTAEPIDLAIISELKEATDDEFAAELIGTFLDEAPVMLAELKEALAGGEVDAFRRAAHSLKSNANVFGAGPLAELARQFEIDGFGSDGDAAQVLALESEYERAAVVLRNLQDG